jgi:hypothetical protein
MMDKWSFSKIVLEPQHNQFLEESFRLWSLYGRQVGTRGDYVFYILFNTDTSEVSVDRIMLYKSNREWSPTEIEYNSIESLLIGIRDERLQEITSAEVEFTDIPSEYPNDATVNILLQFLQNEMNNHYSPNHYLLK